LALPAVGFIAWSTNQFFKCTIPSGDTRQASLASATTIARPSLAAAHHGKARFFANLLWLLAL
jgi:hypothetical protein